jgi:hypothetical protein
MKISRSQRQQTNDFNEFRCSSWSILTFAVDINSGLFLYRHPVLRIVRTLCGSLALNAPIIGSRIHPRWRTWILRPLDSSKSFYHPSQKLTSQTSWKAWLNRAWTGAFFNPANAFLFLLAAYRSPKGCEEFYNLDWSKLFYEWSPILHGGKAVLIREVSRTCASTQTIAALTWFPHWHRPAFRQTWLVH